MRYFYLKNAKDNIRHCQTDPVWRAHILDIADKSINNTFIFSEKYEMERCTVPVHFERIDWDHIPFGDNEWCFAFNRHTFLLNNALAAAITGDTKYRDNWIRLFEDFYQTSALSEKTKNLSWRSLESGIRIENYIRSLEILFSLGMEPEKKVIDEISSFFETHVEYLLSTHTSFHKLSNWGILQDHGLFLASLYLERKDVAETAIKRIDEEMALQTMRDGMHWEQSSMYQAEVLHCALDTVLVADRNKIKIPHELRENTRLLALGLARTLRPDGRCYLFGDSDEIDMRDMIASAAVILSDSELAYWGQDGQNGEFWLSHELDTRLPEAEKPASLSFFFPDSGNAILRLEKDTALRFHSGFMGSGHGHLDQLHFDLYDNGSVILTDTGRYTYVDNKERRALKGSYGHNTIIIGKKEMSDMIDSWEVRNVAEPLFNEAKLDGNYKFISASHKGYASKGAFVTRNIVTIGNRFVIIADDISVTDKTETEILFHLDEGTVVSKEGSTFVCRKDKRTVKLFFPYGEKAEISEYPMSKRYNELLSAPLITLRTTAEGRKCLITLIAIGDDDFSCTAEPLTKSLTGLEIPRDISSTLSIEDGDNHYSVAILTNEYPSGGFLIKAGNAEAFGKIFISRNDERPTILKY